MTISVAIISQALNFSTVKPKSSIKLKIFFLSTVTIRTKDTLVKNNGINQYVIA